MADEIDDSRFKSEVIRMLGNLVNKANEHDRRFDEQDRRFDEHDRRFDEHDKRFDNLQVKLDTLSDDFKVVKAQFNDVGSMAIKDNKRIDVLEARVSEIESGVH
ncbi:MAG: hypothetical protein KF855_02235 [Acidobacteria bacterium]|nr:hypothetical protein [Acidobacteriota bacterium]